MKWNSSWLMVLCVVGMGSVFILPILGISLGSFASLLLILLCPLSHLLMIRGTRSGDGSCHGDSAENVRDSVPRAAGTPRSLPSGHAARALVADSGAAVRAAQGES
jgi:hypothetical protein